MSVEVAPTPMPTTFSIDSNSGIFVDENKEQPVQQTPPRTPTTPRSPRFGTPRNLHSPRASVRRAPPPDPEAVSTLAAKFMSGESVASDDPVVLASVVMDLEAKRDQLMVEGNFRESIKAQQAIDNARKSQLEAIKKQSQKEFLEEIAEKRALAQNEMNETIARLKKEEENIKERNFKLIKEVEERHKMEIQDFDNEWQSEAKQRRYNRSSQALRNLRIQQQQLMNARRYDEAEQVCALADNLAKVEIQAGHREMMRAFLAARDVLLKKHAAEMEIARTTVDHRIDTFNRYKDQQMAPHISRMKLLDKEEEVGTDPERVWALKHRNDGDPIQMSGTPRAGRQNMKKPANVADFNVLPLPKLPKLGTSQPVSPRQPEDEMSKTI